ncbi:PTS sugar transporter subunit IIA [Spiroplasma sp. SV19]|uniref:PTS sugar transporter subunit IIA n=1 Tax=Spiroplasma sp. SV19 TaxID=2570468 RepID=UPI0024B80F02|nr:PTS sugar transporter subunit IIA [Spiroplasma sp. SV19]WHQ36845.1 hypothetical protein E7Y35_02940 [Spiroplasma sp. SV19]
MILQAKDIYLNKSFSNKSEAIEYVGNLMIEKGWINESYKKGMFLRDQKVSVAIGNYLAIPHCEETENINEEGIIFLKLKDELQWDHQPIRFVIGLALKGNHQIDTLQDIAFLFSDEDTVLDFYQKCSTVSEIIAYLANEEWAN